MNISGERKFYIIGENIHTTRVLSRKGKLIGENPEGAESIRFYDADRKRHYLVIPEDIKETQDYQEGRVKHVKVALQAAMSGREPEAGQGMEYLRRLVRRQVEAGADFLDLNVDEISMDVEEQKKAIQWLVHQVREMCPVPAAVDSSNLETLEAGLAACAETGQQPLLNSASQERPEALELAARYNTRVVLTAAGESDMPQDTQERVVNASTVIDAALGKGIALADIFVDPLVLPISVDYQYGNHCLDAFRQLREKYGPEIHLTGGLSTISFGVPSRALVNDVFMILAVDAGADSGIIDPVASRVDQVFSMDRESKAFQLASEMLRGEDPFCANFLIAYREGALEDN